jgi:hypothetical protein
MPNLHNKSSWLSYLQCCVTGDSDIKTDMTGGMQSRQRSYVSGQLSRQQSYAVHGDDMQSRQVTNVSAHSVMSRRSSGLLSAHGTASRHLSVNGRMSRRVMEQLEEEEEEKKAEEQAAADEMGSTAAVPDCFATCCYTK